MKPKHDEARPDQEDAEKSGDDILRRMLATPPQPKAAKPAANDKRSRRARKAGGPKVAGPGVTRHK